ncbi:phosphatidate cytidylyltransferase [Desulfofundulus thermocisternus]|uniref:phosphatidate cytidylyltransferase n=1 Tax=Desulfofundulus thermocisternus TaxID=42471 RepID=UPI00217D6FD3|nr:phosphatidate cytidylyltransferase [Desulfofundulus thermocisternus]MCS5696118.1 phosphatidate cytidylyltransferase [Desulfofundulus thermocisternus]
MLGHRILSALVGIPLFIAAVWYGNLFLLVFTGLLMVLAAVEIVALFQRINLYPPHGLAILGSLFLLGSSYLYRDAGLAGAVALVLFIILILMVFLYPAFSPVEGAVTLLAILYTGLFVYIYLLRLLPDGWVWLTFTLVGTWSSDTVAYFVGKSWGRRQLAPALSPSKTVEGALGSIVGSILAAVAFIIIYPFLPRGLLLLLGLLLGVAAILGDLVESAFKRQAGVKDAGDIIPGHGGILDRFDSMLFTAPLVYYYVGMFIIS